MERLNAKFDKILAEKAAILQDIAISKSEKRKMTAPVTDKEDIGYSVKNTLSKIALEQDRKLKSSKAYQRTQEYVNTTS